jgi:heme O synthase-like polyprenyltransferase
MTFTMAFNIEIFLNPNTWPAPFYLVPNILFIGGALFSVIYRYRHITEPRQKQAMRWYVFSLVLLTTLYFVNLSLTDIYLSVRAF